MFPFLETRYKKPDGPRKAPVSPLPVVYSPVTKYFARWGGKEHGYCREFYMDCLRCVSTVGSQRGQYECFKECADFNECVDAAKQKEYLRIIREEREKQKRPYIEPLPEDIMRSFIWTPPAERAPRV